MADALEVVIALSAANDRSEQQLVHIGGHVEPLLGWQSSELIGCRLPEFFAPLDELGTLDAIIAAALTESNVEARLPVLRKNRPPIKVEVLVSPSSFAHEIASDIALFMTRDLAIDAQS